MENKNVNNIEDNFSSDNAELKCAESVTSNDLLDSSERQRLFNYMAYRIWGNFGTTSEPEAIEAGLEHIYNDYLNAPPQMRDQIPYPNLSAYLKTL